MFKRQLLELFEAWREHTVKRLQNKAKMAKAVEFNTSNETMKCFEVLRLHANLEIQARQVVEYITVKRNKRYLKQSFEILQWRREMAKKERQLAKQTLARNERSIFKMWMQKCQITAALKPEKDLMLKYVKKNILKKTFGALYLNRTSKILKKSLIQRADSYLHENLKSKALMSLNWYADKINYKREINYKAEV